METSFTRLLDEFASSPMPAGRSLRALLDADIAAFLQSALPLLRSAPPGPGFHYLLTLLHSNGLILKPLSDPAVFTLEESIRLARLLLKIEPLMDVKMVRGLLDSKQPEAAGGKNGAANKAEGIRILDILAAVSDGPRILPLLSQLNRHPDPWIRSKAALITGQCNKNHKWVEQRLAEGDARVRANAVESLWGVPTEGCRSVLWGAVADSDNRVVGNALIGLYLQGDPGSIRLTLEMLKDSRETHRITAFWVMGESGDPRFLDVLAAEIARPGVKARGAILRSIAKLKAAAPKDWQAGLLGMRVSQAPSDSPGALNLQVPVWSAAGGSQARALTGLRGTDFAVYENGDLVTEYEVGETAPPENAFTVFLLPARSECEAAFRQAILHKRESASWLILPYAGTQAGNSSPEAQFATDPEVILEAVKQAAGLPGGLTLTDAATAAITALGQTKGTRNLVILQGPSPPPEGDPVWQEIQGIAQPAKTALQVIPTAGLETACAALTHAYLIHYQPPSLDSSAGATVKVRVRCAEGFAQATLTRAELPAHLHP